MKVADEKVAQLEAANVGLRSERASFDDMTATLQAQIDRRDDEIERLGRLLEAAVPISAVHTGGGSQKDQRRVAQLDTQVSYLQETNKALEKEIATTAAENEELALRVGELQTKNNAIMKELEHFDLLSREQELEKVSAEAAAIRGIQSDKALIAKERAALAEQRNEIEIIKQDYVRLKGENQHLLASLSNSNQGFKDDVMASVDSNKRLRELELQLTATRKENETLLRQLQIKTDVGEAAAAVATNCAKLVSSDVAGNTSLAQNETKVAATERNELGAVESKAMVEQLQSLEGANRELLAVFKSVEQERDFYKRAYDVSNDSDCARGRGSAQDSGSEAGDGLKGLHEWSAIINRLSAERDNLALQLEASQLALTEMKNTRDDDNYNIREKKLLSQLTDQQHVSDTATRRIVELDAELKSVRHDLENARETNKNVSMHPNPNNPSTDVTQMRAAIIELDAVRDRQNTELDAQAEIVAALQDEVGQKNAKLTETIQEGTKSAALVAHLDNKLGDAAREIESLRDQLSIATANVTHESRRAFMTGDKMKALNEDLDALTRENQSMQAELIQQTESKLLVERQVKELSGKASYLERMLEAKNEEHDILQESCKKLRESVSELESMAVELNAQITRLEDQLNIKEQRISDQAAELDRARLDGATLKEELAKTQSESRDHVAELQRQHVVARRSEAETLELRRSLDAARGLAEASSDGKELLSKQLTDLGNRNRTLETLLHQTKARLDNTDRRSDSGSEKTSELEDLLADARMKLVGGTQRTEKLSVENKALKSSLLELTKRAKQLSRDVKVLETTKVHQDEEILKLRRALTAVKYKAATPVQEYPQ